MMRSLVLSLLLAFLPAARAQAADASFDVLDYQADLRIDPAAGTVSGDVAVRFESRIDGLAAVDLDAPGLTIEAVTAGGHLLAQESRDGRLRIELAVPLARGATGAVSIRYAGHPQKGMRFTPGQVFTAFTTEAWLVSKADPGDKATLTLALTLPAELGVAASGREVSREDLPGGLSRHVFRLDRPCSTYLYGFAAARFHEAKLQVGGVLLRYLSPVFTPEEMLRIGDATADALAFFEQKAGLPYPGDTYTQVLLPGGPPQEMAGLSLLSEEYGRSVLADPREDALVVHELAHQWWGNYVTCASWSDFWLNEGMVSFLTAAFREQRWGRDEYDRERALARIRYRRAWSQLPERPLAFDGWKTPREMSGPVTYSKGALVLHLLRHEAGERPFWEGLRTFTQAGAAAGIVVSDDLRAALEKAAARDLRPFFAQWVRGGSPELVARHRLEPGTVVVEIEQRQETPWTLPVAVAVETANGRQSRRLELRGRREDVRFAVDAPVLSVRVDDGEFLPRPIDHRRSGAMLRHQLESEADTPGRVEALLALFALCTDPAGDPVCRDLPRIRQETAAGDSSRLVRQLAAEGP